MDNRGVCVLLMGFPLPMRFLEMVNVVMKCLMEKR